METEKTIKGKTNTQITVKRMTIKGNSHRGFSSLSSRPLEAGLLHLGVLSLTASFSNFPCIHAHSSNSLQLQTLYVTFLRKFMVSLDDSHPPVGEWVLHAQM